MLFVVSLIERRKGVVRSVEGQVRMRKRGKKRMLGKVVSVVERRELGVLDLRRWIERDAILFLVESRES